MSGDARGVADTRSSTAHLVRDHAPKLERLGNAKRSKCTLGVSNGLCSNRGASRASRLPFRTCGSSGQHGALQAHCHSLPECGEKPLRQALQPATLHHIALREICKQVHVLFRNRKHPTKQRTQIKHNTFTHYMAVPSMPGTLHQIPTMSANPRQLQQQ